jgi:hypothetical protein
LASEQGIFAANTAYRLGAQYNINDTDPGISQATSTTGPDVSLGSACFSSSLTLAFPNNPGWATRPAVGGYP